MKSLVRTSVFKGSVAFDPPAPLRRTFGSVGCSYIFSSRIKLPAMQMFAYLLHFPLKINT